MFFHESGYALHGAYWHDNFGYRMSHGCVNLRPDDASWLFRWTDPVYEPGNWYSRGTGTLVLVKE
jgi:lipoprotein-anchoring transpeptidase ErfK/SrfK